MRNESEGAIEPSIKKNGQRRLDSPSQKARIRDWRLIFRPICTPKQTRWTAPR
ncbi:MAG: hypothetical protein U7127_07490 [Phormidium sp.]